MAPKKDKVISINIEVHTEGRLIITAQAKNNKSKKREDINMYEFLGAMKLATDSISVSALTGQEYRKTKDLVVYRREGRA